MPPCVEALIGVAAVGLPAGFVFYCTADRTDGSPGLAYYDPNPGGEWYIAVDPTYDSAYVGAHEACHAQDFTRIGTSTEASADACAAAAGYPRSSAGDFADVAIVASQQERAEHWLTIAALIGVLAVLAAALTTVPALRRRINR